MEEIQLVAIDTDIRVEISVVEIHGISEIQHVAIDIDVPMEVSVEKNNEEMATGEDGLLNLMKKKLDEMPSETLVSIIRLPALFHEMSKQLCEPKLVSIGPYHHGKDGLRDMDKHKLSSLQNFLDRNTNVGLDLCLREMRALEPQARQCYSDTVNQSSDEFVMMLLLDGCFILERLYEPQQGESRTDYRVGWAVHIDSDLFLFENQIPFFVIKKLVELQDGRSHNCEGRPCPLLKQFQLPPIFYPRYLMPPQISCSNIQHLLDLYYRNMVHDVRPLVEVDEIEWDHNGYNISCVSELNEAGVKFKKKISSDVLDVEFKNGIMEIPYLSIDDTGKIISWNMAAFEQSQRDTYGQTFSSYLALMDSLINTEKDFAILERSGIFENYLQNNEEAAAFFSEFGKHFGLDYTNHPFRGLFKDIKAYSDSSWHKLRARLMHDYFSNPWSTISVGAAGTLLILTFVQAVYAAK